LGRALVAKHPIVPGFAGQSVGLLAGLLGTFSRMPDKRMSEPTSELVEIFKLNGDFKRNYGRLLSGYLYLRSISAAGGRSYFWGAFRGVFIRTGLVGATRLDVVTRWLIGQRTLTVVASVKPSPLLRFVSTADANLRHFTA
jgi:hypothetical protein